jgi:hypothetical protein
MAEAGNKKMLNPMEVEQIHVTQRGAWASMRREGTRSDRYKKKARSPNKERKFRWEPLLVLGGNPKA